MFSGTFYLDRLAGLGMRQYQVIQEDYGQCVNEAHPISGSGDRKRACVAGTTVRQMFESKFGNELTLHIEFVSRIEPTAAGKHVYMISRVTETVQP